MQCTIKVIDNATFIVVNCIKIIFFMAENNTFTFVVSDESVNKYGYRVLTDGIDTTEFEKNPVMFWNHHRSEEWTGDVERLPIGRWENLRVEDGKLLMDAVLDENDEFSMKIRDKISNDILNAASIGIQLIDLSDDPESMLPGQTRSTVTKSILQEVSIVDIPANSNAMKLNFNDDVLTLSDGFDIDKLNSMIPVVEVTETKDENKSVVDMINNAISVFWEKLNSKFNITPKEETTTQDDLDQVVESFRSDIGSIEIPVDETLKSSVDQMSESMKQIESMFDSLKSANEMLNSKVEELEKINSDLKTEMLNLKAGTTKTIPANDPNILNNSSNQHDDKMKEQFKQFGNLGKKQLNKQ